MSVSTALPTPGDHGMLDEDAARPVTTMAELGVAVGQEWEILTSANLRFGVIRIERLTAPINAIAELSLVPLSPEPTELALLRLHAALADCASFGGMQEVEDALTAKGLFLVHGEKRLELGRDFAALVIHNRDKPVRLNGEDLVLIEDMSCFAFQSEWHHVE